MPNSQKKMSAAERPFDVRHRFQSERPVVGLAAAGSALLDAVNKGKVHLAKFILEAADCDVVNTRDFNGKTSLMRACYIQVSLFINFHENLL